MALFDFNRTVLRYPNDRSKKTIWSVTIFYRTFEVRYSRPLRRKHWSY